jgi:hypothetical protein
VKDIELLPIIQREREKLTLAGDERKESVRNQSYMAISERLLHNSVKQVDREAVNESS